MFQTLKIQQEIEDMLTLQRELSGLAPCYADADLEMVQQWIDERVELALAIEEKLAELEQIQGF